MECYVNQREMNEAALLVGYGLNTPPNVRLLPSTWTANYGTGRVQCCRFKVSFFLRKNRNLLINITIQLMILLLLSNINSNY